MLHRKKIFFIYDVIIWEKIKKVLLITTKKALNAHTQAAQVGGQ